MSAGSGARHALLFVLSLVVLAVVAAASVALGARDVGLADIGRGLRGDSSSVASAAVAARLPRTLLAVLVGAALAVAGACMQGLARNPLADPGLLGVTPGASLAVVCGMTFFGLSSPILSVWVAIAGASVAAVLVYGLGSLGRGGATPLKVTLAGAAISAAITSAISAVLLPRPDVMDSFRFWQIGGVGGADLQRISMIAPFLIVGTVLSLGVARGLNALALGDELAAGLGQRVELTRALAGVAAVVLCGAATAVAGPIGFVGLVVPHACRLLWGSDHRWLMPMSAVVGAVLLTLADVVGRTIARPSEVDVGIVTAVIGAPIFIAIVRRTKARAL